MIPAPQTSKLPARTFGLSIVAVAMIAMLIVSWRCWPDPIADFGRELYVPWQLAQGKVLYRDIAWFNGPLSPYFNSVLFRIFGASLMTLAWVNIAILAAVVVMLHRIAARISDEFAATVATLAFVLLLAIGQPGPAANYNFITPYSHEMTHGFALALGAILCAMNWARSKWIAWPQFCGAILGCVFLTKPEIFLAAAAACAVAFALSTSRLFGFSVLIMTTLLAPCVALLIFGKPALGGWQWVFNSALINQPFYRIVRGTDDLARSLRLIFTIGAGYVIVFGIPLLIGRVAHLGNQKRAIAAGTSLALVALALGGMHEQINWPEIGRPLVLVVVAIFIGLWIRLARTRDRGDRVVAQLVFATFALVLLFKIAFHVVLYHYGFVLACPALVLAIAASTCWIPGWLNRHGGCGAFSRFGAVGALLTTCIVYLSYASAHFYFREKWVQVGKDRDAFYTDARGDAVNEMLDALSNAPASETLAVVPQGAMINFLARRTNPTPFIALMPPEIIMFGGDRITGGFRQHPPDLILIVRTDLGEYGYRSFHDYAPELVGWIDANYTTPARGRSDELPWTLLRRTQ